MLEIAWIAESVVKRDVAPRPFVLLGEFWRPVVETALAEASNPSGTEALARCARFAGTPREAVMLAVDIRNG